jgi:Flp pilus assembly protein TadG
MIKLDRRHRTRGQGLVEFALILPIFLLIIFGILDIGRAVYAYNTVANSARIAARVALVNQDAEAVEKAAVDEAVGLGLHWSPSAPYSNNVTFATCGTEYCLATVTVTWDFQPATPLIGNLFNPTISSTSSIPIEVVNP